VTTITIIGKPECHLCATAHEIIEQVIAELPDAAADQIEVAEASIIDDPALHELWWDKIPVVLIDDEVHSFWRVSPAALREKLLTP
jgi:glutaredoxin